jgi:hypothetical protein
MEEQLEVIYFLLIYLLGGSLASDDLYLLDMRNGEE